MVTNDEHCIKPCHMLNPSRQHSCMLMPPTCQFVIFPQFKSFLQCTLQHRDYYEPFLEMLGGLGEEEEGEGAGGPEEQGQQSAGGAEGKAGPGAGEGQGS